jgi:hypothetical protein
MKREIQRDARHLNTIFAEARPHIIIEFDVDTAVLGTSLASLLLN